MVSEIESGDAITRLQKQYKKQEEYELRKAQKAASETVETPSFEAPATRTDG